QSRLTADEEEQLADEKRRLSSAEEIKSLAGEAYQTISGNSGQSAPVLDQINQALTPLRHLAGLDHKLESLYQNFESVNLTMTELARDLKRYSNTVESNPARLLEVENRLILIGELKRKYGRGIGEILNFRAKVADELNKLIFNDSQSLELENCIRELE